MKETIEQELLRATKEPAQKKNESRQKYLGRLVRTTNEVDDSVWESLSDEAQTWVNAGVKAINCKEDIEDFPDAIAGGGDDDDGELERKSGGKADDKKESAPKPKKRAATSTFRRLQIEHPDWDKKKLLEETEKAGFTISPSTADIIFYETKSTLDILNELGKLKK